MNNYHNEEKVKIYGGGTIVRKVSIKGGRGYKSVSTYKGGKHRSTIKKPLKKQQIKKILAHKFIPGLFKDCVNC